MSPSGLRRGDAVRIRDERWVVLRCAAHEGGAILDVRGADRGNRGRRARYILPFEPCVRLPSPEVPRIVTPRQWRHLARAALAAAMPVPEGLRTLARANADIHPFQLEPALAIVRGLASRVLIADDVGLGKTVQAGLVVAEILEREPAAQVLVLTPAALRDQWAHELQHRFDLAPVVIDAAAMAAAGRVTTPGANPWSAQPLAIVSIDYLKRAEVLRGLEALVWDLIVVDEAHLIARPSDRQTAARALGERARRFLMLTATPHSGDDEAFGRLCGLADLEQRFPLLVFRRTRDDAGLAGRRRTQWLHVRPTPVEREMHSALLEYARLVWRQGTSAPAARLAMAVLARRACSSAGALGASIERRLAALAAVPPAISQLALPLDGGDADDDAPGPEIEAPGLADEVDERARLEHLLALSRQARRRESKMAAIARLLRRSGERAIVFTQYRDTLDHLAAALESHRTGQLHGGLTAAERADVLRRFASEHVHVLLATDAASEGLNLHRRCRLVVHLEVPWTPLRIEQRVGRVDRIGQPHGVHQVLLVAAGTAEWSVVEPLVRQRTRRVHRALESLRAPAVHERLVAAALLGDSRGAADDGVPTGVPPGVIVGDLTNDAAADAARAATQRALSPGGGDTGGRMFAASAAPHVSRACWAHTVECCGAGEDLPWRTILGAWYDLPARRLRSADDIRVHILAGRDAVARAVAAHQQGFADRVRRTAEEAIAECVAREQAIIASLTRRNARLAAALIQPGLFDRRAERDAAAQRAEMEEALRRCAEHLAGLAGRLDIAPPVMSPLFALFLE